MTKYKIKTIEQLAQVVNEGNLKTLVGDITTWLGCVILTRKIGEAGTPILFPTDVFNWTDDGKNEITIRIKKGESNE